MKIDKPVSGPQGVKQNAPAKSGSGEGADFRQLLENHLQSLGGVGASEKTAPAGSVEGVPAALRLDGLSLTETALDTLEAYGNALGSKSVAAAELEPFIDALEEETAGLLALREELPAGDPLSELLDRVATVAYLETAKFRRGDYAA